MFPKFETFWQQICSLYLTLVCLIIELWLFDMPNIRLALVLGFPKPYIFLYIYVSSMKHLSQHFYHSMIDIFAHQDLWNVNHTGTQFLNYFILFVGSQNFSRVGRIQTIRVHTLKPILINRKDDFVYHHWECTSIYHLLSHA